MDLFAVYTVKQVLKQTTSVLKPKPKCQPENQRQPNATIEINNTSLSSAQSP